MSIDSRLKVSPFPKMFNTLNNELRKDQVKEIAILARDKLSGDKFRECTEMGGAALLFKIRDEAFLQNDVLFVEYLINVTEEMNAKHIKVGTVCITDMLQDCLTEYENYLQWRSENGLTRNEYFVGRGDMLEDVKNQLKNKSLRAISLHGMGGMGKSTVATEACLQLTQYDIYRVDLRSKSTTSDFMLKLLSALEMEGSAHLDEDEKRAKVIAGISGIKTETIIYLDNVDEYMHDHNLTGFLTEMNRLMDLSDKVKFLMTTRTEVIKGDSNLIDDKADSEARLSFLEACAQFKVGELSMLDSKDVIKKYCSDRVQEKLLDVHYEELARCCGFNPLALSIISTHLENNPYHPYEIISRIQPQSQHRAGILDAVNSCLQTTFDGLSDENKEALVKLAVLDGSFDENTAKHILDLSCYETKYRFINLCCKHLVEKHDIQELRKGNKKDKPKQEIRFSLHPLIHSFLNGLVNTGQFSQSFEDGKVHFMKYFEKLLFQVAKEAKTDCLKALKNYQKNSVHMLKYLQLRREHGDRMKISNTKEYKTAGYLHSFIEAIYDNHQKIEYYMEAFVSAKNAGRNQYAFMCLLNLLEHWITVSNFFQATNMMKGDFLVESVNTLKNKNDTSNHEKLLLAQWLYVEGMYTIKAPATEGGQDFEKGKALLLQCLSIQEPLLKKHYLIARTLNEIGRAFFEISKDYRKSENTEPYLKSLEYHQRACDMICEISEDEMNFALPEYTNNIGSVYHVLAHNMLENNKKEEAEDNYKRALQYYKKSIRLEEKMNVDKPIRFASYKRNMAMAEMALHNYGEALKHAVDVHERYGIIAPLNPQRSRAKVLVAEIYFRWARHGEEEGKDGMMKYYEKAAIWYAESSEETLRHNLIHVGEQEYGLMEEHYPQTLDKLGKQTEKERIENAFRMSRLSGEASQLADAHQLANLEEESPSDNSTDSSPRAVNVSSGSITSGSSNNNGNGISHATTGNAETESSNDARETNIPEEQAIKGKSSNNNGNGISHATTGNSAEESSIAVEETKIPEEQSINIESSDQESTDNSQQGRKRIYSE